MKRTTIERVSLSAAEVRTLVAREINARTGFAIEAERLIATRGPTPDSTAFAGFYVDVQVTP